MAEGEGRARAANADAPLAREASEAFTGTPGESDERIERLEARVLALSDALGSMETRLRGLEGWPEPVSGLSPDAVEPALVSGLRERSPSREPAFEAPSTESEPSVPGDHVPGPTLGDVLPHIAGIGGRTLLILGGGYLLRDLTERGTLAPATGALFGLLYATVWLLLADRQARLEPSTSAAFYGVSFALTAFPLLGEVTVRFEVLTPVAAALAFAAAAGAGIFVAWRRRLSLTAWAVLALVAFTVAGTVLQTRQPMPFLLLLVALGVGLDWAATSRQWFGVRLAAAAVADLGMLVFALSQLLSEQYSPRATLVQLALFGAYMLFYSVRAQVEKRALTGFERLQAGAVLVIGYLGAVWVAHRTPDASRAILGAASLLVGAGAYAIAYFLFVVPGRNRVEAWFNTSYALVGVVVGSWLVMAEPGFAWAGIGVLLAVLGARDKHAALPLHAAVCALAATLGSGLLAQVWDAFWASPRVPWSALDAPALASLAVAVFVYFMPLESPRVRALLPSQAAKTLALAVSVAGLGGVAMALLAGPAGGGLGEGADAGRMAALRTAILAASAFGLACASRVERLREAAFLVYPVLGLGAVKLVAQDFPNGRALTLFVGLVLFGVASTVAPRLRHHEPKPASVRAK